jgi:hypothetical protein
MLFGRGAGLFLTLRPSFFVCGSCFGRRLFPTCLVESHHPVKFCHHHPGALSKSRVFCFCGQGWCHSALQPSGGSPHTKMDTHGVRWRSFPEGESSARVSLHVLLGFGPSRCFWLGVTFLHRCGSREPAAAKCWPGTHERA